MTRRLRTLVSVLSLLLCLAAVGMWVRSYRVRDSLTFGIRGGKERLIYLVAGHVQFITFMDNRSHGGFNLDRQDMSDGISYMLFPSGVWQRGGFAFGQYQEIALSRNAPPINCRAVGTPHWFLAMLFAIPSIVELKRCFASRRHKKTGLCPKCGYDLRATPDRCPECGHASAIVPAHRAT